MFGLEVFVSGAPGPEREGFQKASILVTGVVSQTPAAQQRSSASPSMQALAVRTNST